MIKKMIKAAVLITGTMLVLMGCGPATVDSKTVASLTDFLTDSQEMELISITDNSISGNG